MQPTPIQYRVPIPQASLQWRQGINAQSRPYGGVGPTVQLIHQQADRLAHDPEVRGLAESLTRSVYGKCYLSELAAIYYWSCDPRNVRYMRDPHRVELVKDSHVILRTGQADCDEFDVLLKNLIGARQSRHLAGMASAAGNADVEPVLAGFQSQRNLTHTFVRVKDPRGSGRKAVFDPVAGPLTPRMLLQIKHFESAGVL